MNLVNTSTVYPQNRGGSDDPEVGVEGPDTPSGQHRRSVEVTPVTDTRHDPTRTTGVSRVSLRTL